MPGVEHDRKISVADRPGQIQRHFQVGDAGVRQEFHQDPQAAPRRPLGQRPQHVRHLAERHRMAAEVDHVHRWGAEVLRHGEAALFGHPFGCPGQRTAEAVDVTDHHPGVVAPST